MQQVGLAETSATAEVMPTASAMAIVKLVNMVRSPWIAGVRPMRINAQADALRSGENRPRTQQKRAAKKARSLSAVTILNLQTNVLCHERGATGSGDRM